MWLDPDWVECGSAPSVYFKRLVSQFQIPCLFLSLALSSLLSSTHPRQREVATMALGGYTVGSIITHSTGLIVGLLNETLYVSECGSLASSYRMTL